MSSVNAAVHMGTSSEHRATQSCHATSHGAWVSYSIYIGVTYSGVYKCNDTYNNLEDEVTNISNWQCVEENGNIRLWFNGIPGN
jgi:hypothetical protein